MRVPIKYAQLYTLLCFTSTIILISIILCVLFTHIFRFASSPLDNYMVLILRESHALVAWNCCQWIAIARIFISAVGWRGVKSPLQRRDTGSLPPINVVIFLRNYTKFKNENKHQCCEFSIQLQQFGAQHVALPFPKWNSGRRHLQNLNGSVTRTTPATLNNNCLCTAFCTLLFDDDIKWKHFPCFRPFMRGIHRWPVNSPCKGQ